MSAIAGLWYRDGRAMSVDQRVEIDRALQRFGPGGGAWWQQGGIALGRWAPGFESEYRHGRQPCVDAGGSLVLLFDGRLYNRLELIAQLGLDEQAASGCPDFALVLRACERWGESCLRRLVGAFAFALWNGREQSLLIARSPFAAPPLYYHHHPEGLAFATRPKAIYASGLLRRSVNLPFLADYLVSFPGEPRQTFFQGIQALEGGECLIARGTRLDVRRFWRLEDVRSVRLACDDDYVAYARDVLDRVVADHLRDGTAHAVMMSGGLDSTAIGASAALQLARRSEFLDCFTEVPGHVVAASMLGPGRYADETPLVQATAALHRNMRLHFVQADGFYLDDIEAFFDAAECPFRNASNRLWMEACVRGAAALGCRTLLSGSGGNLSFGRSDDALLTETLRAGHLREALKLAFATSRAGGSQSPVRAFARAALPLLPLPLRRFERRRREGWAWLEGARSWQRYSAIHPALLAETAVAERGLARGFNFDFVPALDARKSRLVALGNNYLADNIDCAWRECFGVWSRRPANDQRLVELSFAIPDRQFGLDGLPRSLIRRLSVGRLPEGVLHNRARGLQNALWFEQLQSAGDSIRDHLDAFGKSPLVCHTLDVPQLKRLAAGLARADASGRETFVQYRVRFEMGLMTGRFLLWVEAQA